MTDGTIHNYRTNWNIQELNPEKNMIAECICFAMPRYHFEKDLA